MNSEKVAIIAGTGFESAFRNDWIKQETETPYGTITILTAENTDGPTVLVHRHGSGHHVPPHKINVHAIIWALKSYGVTTILATAAVGSLRIDLRPGDIVLLSDFIDYRGVVTTFFDAVDGEVRHTDFSEPFSGSVRQVLAEILSKLQSSGSFPGRFHTEGVYLCVNGPRYESPAEVKMFGSLGADVVGMTVAQEAILAHEMDIKFAVAAVVTNLGTGLSDDILKHQDVSEMMLSSAEVLTNVFQETSNRLLQ